MLPEACLRGTKIEEVTLPVSLRKIGKYVFDKCENLWTITVPENVEQIGPSWFSGSNLVEVIIPKTVKIIGERTFLAVIAWKQLFSPKILSYDGLKDMRSCCANNCNTLCCQTN